MAIHWQIKFKSLRAGTVYTANVYDDNFTGTPVQLVGASAPFETEEDTSNDMFAPIRTQSGYLRIVDQGGTFNWRDFIPTTDTDRPVTLTHVEEYGPSETMFPTGMKGIGSVQDEINFETGKAIRRIGSRPYNSSTDTGNDVITDGVTTHYVLDTPVEFTLDSIPTRNYTTASGGTEVWLPENGSAPTTSIIGYTKEALSSNTAKLTKLLGRSLVWNQLISVAETTSAYTGGLTLTKISSNEVRVTGTPTASITTAGKNHSSNPNLPLVIKPNHYYYSWIKKTAGNWPSTGRLQVPYNYFRPREYFNDCEGGRIKQANNTSDYSNNNFLQLGNVPTTEEVDFTYKIIIVDLTLMFGEGNEPTSVAEFEALFPLESYDYNAGTLLSCLQTGFESLDANDNVLTQLSMPVTSLTGKQRGGGSTVVDWQGFLQAQNFGAQLFETPQEREFPLQCSFTVLGCADINYQQQEIKNFAYLLQQIVLSIPSTCRPTEFYIQGGLDAQSWLLKSIDWQNFVVYDADEEIKSPRFTMYDAMEMLCKFWGWTARTFGNKLYLTCADDTEEQTWLYLTTANLNTMAGGTTAGTTQSAPAAVEILDDDIFASTNNQDYQLRGPNNVEITADPNTAEEYICKPMDEKLSKAMHSTDWQDGTLVGDVHYTKDIQTADRELWHASAVPLYASFNAAYKRKNTGDFLTYDEIGDVIRIQQTYYNDMEMVQFYTMYEHLFADGFFRIEGTVYRNGEIYDSRGGTPSFSGNAYMWMRLGIGKTRETAIWWDGQAWQNSLSKFMATIGNKDQEIYTRYWPYPTATAVESNIINVGATGMRGILYVDLLGSDSSVVTDIDGEKSFDIKDFRIRFTKNNTVTKTGPFPNSGFVQVDDVELPKPIYKASNNNNLRQTFSESVDVSSENQMKPGWGILINPDNSFMSEASYDGTGTGTDEHPEQHLANRIVNLWSSSKRMVQAELLTHDGASATDADTLTPQSTVDFEDATLYPFSISRNWRDDVLKTDLMEI